MSKKRTEEDQNRLEEASQDKAPDLEAGQVKQAITVEELEALKKQLQEAQAAVDEYKDGWQRSAADFSNYRKRIEQERLQAYQNAVADIVTRYLPIMDDLERALQDSPGGSWAEGIDLIYRKLRTVLESEGIQRIEAEGQVFDPNFHEALSQESSDTCESGHVIEVVRQGYMLGDRVIRPAAVKVAQ